MRDRWNLSGVRIEMKALSDTKLNQSIPMNHKKCYCRNVQDDVERGKCTNKLKVRHDEVDCYAIE